MCIPGEGAETDVGAFVGVVATGSNGSDGGGVESMCCVGGGTTEAGGGSETSPMSAGYSSIA